MRKWLIHFIQNPNYSCGIQKRSPASLDFPYISLIFWYHWYYFRVSNLQTEINMLYHPSRSTSYTNTRKLVVNCWADITRETHLLVRRSRPRMGPEFYCSSKRHSQDCRHYLGNGLCRKEQGERTSEKDRLNHHSRKAQSLFAIPDIHVVLLDPIREHVVLQDSTRQDCRKRQDTPGGVGDAELRRK